jgi:hypothetical protein
MNLQRMFGKGFKKLNLVDVTFVLVISLITILVAVGFPLKQTGLYNHSNEKDLLLYEAQYIPVTTLDRIANRKFVGWAQNPIVIEAVKEAANACKRNCEFMSGNISY